jgi:hypothetical protein
MLRSRQWVEQIFGFPGNLSHVASHDQHEGNENGETMNCLREWEWRSRMAQPGDGQTRFEFDSDRISDAHALLEIPANQSITFLSEGDISRGLFEVVPSDQITDQVRVHIRMRYLSEEVLEQSSVCLLNRGDGNTVLISVRSESRADGALR